MTTTDMYVNERLDHLGIVAGVCQEIGLAAWLDAQEPGNRQQVSVGTATVAMILNGLGFSNRQLYLVPQYFANKPVEHLLGAGIKAEMLNDDCLGRTLDWLYAHDPTKLFAGIASQARQVFGISAHQVHVDTTSFSVSGAYNSVGERVEEPGKTVEALETETALIAITYGYSRDYREDLKQWMLALATTHEGDVPLFLQPLDGNRSDKVSLLAAVMAIQKQLSEENAEPSVYVADNGIYSESNMRQLNAAGIKWVSRVSETSTEAKTVLHEGSQDWQRSEDGSIQWFCRQMELPQGNERWVIVRTSASEQRARASLQRQVSRAQSSWERKCWHLSNRHFACEADARVALERELKGKPSWLQVDSDIQAHPRHAGKGRPRKEASPATYQWQIVAKVTVNQPLVDEEALRKACFIVGTNELESEALSDQELVTTYKDQGGVERGFRFLKDPLFLASSVFVKKPERIIALSLIMVLCLLVYRLAEYRLRARLAATEQTIPDQVGKPTARPTMRWVFQCFEGIELLQVQTSTTSLTIVLRLDSVHRLILALLGPLYEKIYNPSG
ncbi:MAG: IS1634 family transposase [Ktedonobacteraceae bacterium]